VRGYQVVAATALAVLASGCGSSDESPKSTADGFFFQDRVLNIAHGGGQALAPKETLLAYQTSALAGADVLEGDVHATKDGVLVLIHDDTIDATTNGTGAISDMTFAELQQWDAGYWFTTDGGNTYPERGKGLTVPSLESLLDLFPDAHYVLEIKQSDPPIVMPFLNLLRDKGVLERVLVASFWDDVILDVRAKEPRALTSLATGESLAFAALSEEAEKSYHPPARFIQPPSASAQPDLVERAHRLGMKVHPWTVNDPSEMQSLIATGVDGIITDDPATLSGLLSASK